MAVRGEGVLETFVAVVQEMLAAIAVKYNLKEKGLDPAVVPEVVAQAFSNLLKNAPRATGPPSAGSPARVVLAHPADVASATLPAAGDSSPVSDELLHRAIRSNVELAETLTDVVREMNQGLANILSQAELLQSYRDEGKRVSAIASIQGEAARLRLIIRQIGQSVPPKGGPQGGPPARAGSPTGAFAAIRSPLPVAPAANPPAAFPAPRPVPASPPGPVLAAARPATGEPPPSAGLDGLLNEAVASSRAVLDARSVSVENRVAPGTSPPRCPSVSLRRTAAALLHGLALTLSPGSVIAIRAERKPVLLRGKDGEVKRDFIMLALGHGASLSAADQQRMLQGADPGPLGEAYRLVREMGGFVRFAPLPGGALETRVFLPAA